MLCKSIYDSPLGVITLASDGQNLTGLWIESQLDPHKEVIKDASLDDNLEVFVRVKSWLDRYFAGEKLTIDGLPIFMDGSPFRKAVWNILREIPYGKLITYGDIAKEMAVLSGVDRMSAQAVGGAVGHNPISIIVPCHRVVGTDGNLTGYAGGIDLKIRLLELEGFTVDREKKKVIL